ncbi:MAG: type II toxin-antitoxin system VapC family toxin [Candidatus Levybacteria bacterium]|nr:type II toxin-antitoxin system VapC family toxin [Candidatus Levybacteria bacterium]
MIVLDTNIFIYLANGTLKTETLNENDIAYASITKIEALGYTKIIGAEQSYLETLLDACEQIELNETVIKQAIRLRQQSKLSLGDAIMAASALAHDYELWTANIEDFKHIEDLRLHNPLH